MGSQRVGHDWVTELNWRDYLYFHLWTTAILNTKWACPVPPLWLTEWLLISLVHILLDLFSDIHSHDSLGLTFTLLHHSLYPSPPSDPLNTSISPRMLVIDLWLLFPQHSVLPFTLFQAVVSALILLFLSGWLPMKDAFYAISLLLKTPASTSHIAFLLNALHLSRFLSTPDIP